MSQHLQGPAQLCGEIRIPASKSHTIRALLIAALAEGTSRILNPLEAEDPYSALTFIEALGAKVEKQQGLWIVNGCGSQFTQEKLHVDVGNSGTTLYLASALAALSAKGCHFDGDASIRKRSAKPLLQALESLGAKVPSMRSCPPYTISGTLKCGEIELAAPTSQYLSALLLACPLIKGEEGSTTIRLQELNEKPYVKMTLDWLEKQNIKLEYASDYSYFSIPNNQHYSAFEHTVAGDYSSATFFLCAAALSLSHLKLSGLPVDPTQGDSKIVDMLAQMGLKIERNADTVEVFPSSLHGVELDLNDTPDALPALAVTACFASGTTRLYNVAQARIKETNRIAVMREQLSRLGAIVQERDDGLEIKGGHTLNPNFVYAHHDHRIVMALAIASLAISGGVTIDNTEAAKITFPHFFDELEQLKLPV